MNLEEQYEIGIVLCHEIDKSGNLSKETIARTDFGIELYKRGKIKKIVLSGGKINGNSFSVAEKMLEYGYTKIREIPLVEDISLDTSGQLIFLKEAIIDPLKIKSFCIITHNWHLPKTEFMAKYLFPEGYKMKFMGIEPNKYLKEGREDIKKIPQFLETFKKLAGHDGTLTEYLLKYHPWYSGAYPFAKFNKGYFSNNVKRIKEKYS